MWSSSRKNVSDHIALEEVSSQEYHFLSVPGMEVFLD